MKIPRSLQPRDALGFGSLIGLTALLYTTGGQLAAAFGVAAIGAWLLGPPVFAFAIGQAGVAVVFTPADLSTLAAGELALLGLLLSDVDVPSPFHNWSVAVLLGGLVAAAVVGVLALERSLTTAAAVSVVGVGTVVYAVHRYGNAGTIETVE